MEQKKKRKWLRLLWIPAGILIIALIYVAYVFIAYYRVEDNLSLEVVNARPVTPTDVAATDTPYTLISYNVGFGAYSADFSFFMDGGKESRARSAEEARDNIGGAMQTVAAQSPDFIFIQELDTDGTRSHHIDQRYIVLYELPAGEWQYAFAQNYDSPYLFYPFLHPHGANKSGIMTLSSKAVTSSLRRSLPVENSVMKLVDLDRCYSVTRVPVAGSEKELILYNLHLSAYTSDGTIAVEQLQMLVADMTEEYEKGNYCVAGGDFNKDLPGNSAELFGVPAPKDSNWAQPIPEGVISPELTLIVPLHEDAPVASCRTASESYDPATTFRITVDGSTYWKTRSVDFDGLVRQELAALAPGVTFDIFRIDEAPMVGAAVAAVGNL